MITDVVANDLCIGCGLCEAVTGGRVSMVLTSRGSLRPSPVEAIDQEEDALLVAVCPGVVAEARTEPGWVVDPIWGAHGTMRHAWAADDDIRFRAATGGVLTALGVHLLVSGRAAFVLHVGSDPDRPMRSRWVLSDTAEDVIANAGSRYGPTAPLAGLADALDRDEPFAIIAKPCDLGAVHRLAGIDPRIDRRCVARLALVCGGQSRLSKSTAVLDEYGVDEREVTLFRYRGHGNPGATRVETSDGRSYEKTYLELWEDEASWDVETRCKLCPDPLGEASDVAAADVWPGGAPTGEDEGFNGIIVRSTIGEELVDGAVRAGHLVVGDPITPRQFDDFQPHQVRKKEALASRFRGMADAGVTPIRTVGLRIDAVGRRLDPAAAETERAGARRRMEALR